MSRSQPIPSPTSYQWSQVLFTSGSIIVFEDFIHYAIIIYYIDENLIGNVTNLKPSPNIPTVRYSPCYIGTGPMSWNGDGKAGALGCG